MKRVILVPKIAEQLKSWAGVDREYTILKASFGTSKVAVEVRDTQDSARVFWVNLDEVILVEQSESN